ncbi:MAG: EipA family protein, partial [Methylovirgula sp.]
MRAYSRREIAIRLALAAAAGAAWPGAAYATVEQQPNQFSGEEVIRAGHHFFGTISRGLAEVVQAATRRWGQPNGYILGQEASGAFVGGLRYGEGMIYTRNAGDRKVFWQGPSLGFDAGADGDRTMMLVYGLPSVGAVFRR